MAVFTVIFGRLAKLPSEGVAYPVLVFCGMLPWQFFANSFSESGNSLVANSNLISKIYFPRVFIPLGAILALAVDLLLSLLLCFPLMAYYACPPTMSLLWLPVFLLGTVLAASGVGLILSAVNVQFRDIKYVIPFIVQLGIFVTPVIYPAAYVPEKYRVLPPIVKTRTDDSLPSSGARSATGFSLAQST